MAEIKPTAEDYRQAAIKWKGEYRKERSSKEMMAAKLRETEVLLELANGQLASCRQSKIKVKDKMQLNSSIKLASVLLIAIFLTACTSFVESTHTWDDGSTSQIRSSAVTHPVHGGATENRFKNCDASGACSSKVVTNSNPSMVGTFSEVGASAIDTTNDYGDDTNISNDSSSNSKASIRKKKTVIHHNPHKHH
jgi:hypothetical protein